MNSKRLVLVFLCFGVLFGGLSCGGQQTDSNDLPSQKKVSEEIWGTGLEVSNPKELPIVIDSTPNNDLIDPIDYTKRFREADKKTGLSEELIRAKVELQLLRNGIKSVDFLSGDNEFGHCFYVNVYVHGPVHTVSINFRRLSEYTVEGRTYAFEAISWQKSGSGSHGGNSPRILKMLSNYVDIFINAYQKANPSLTVPPAVTKKP